jgi:superfamily II DNA or RNA helicase
MRKATPVRMWSEQTDGSLLFMCGYVPKVCELLVASGISVDSYTRIDRTDTLEYDLSTVDIGSMRPEQIKMMETIVSSEGGQIQSPTGSGKTYFLGELCRLYPQANIIIAAPGIETVATAKRYLEEKFPGDVGQVGGGRSYSRRITVATYDSVIKVNNIEHCDILVVDEAHRAAAESYSKDFASIHSPLKRFGITATAKGRSDKCEWLTEGMFGPLVLKIEYQESVASGSVVPLEVIVHENPDGPTQDAVSMCRTQAMKDRMAIWRNQERNRRIAKDVYDIIAKLGGDPQVLVIAERIEHLLALKELLPDFEVAYGNLDAKGLKRINKRMGTTLQKEDVVTPKERNALRERYETGEAKRVLATGIFATGVSSNYCRVVAVTAGYAASIPFLQSIGRGSRTSEGKDFCICLIWRDMFCRTFKARSDNLIRAATGEGHRVTKIPADKGVDTWIPPPKP